MGKATKATKKFLKNSLQTEKDRRNKQKPIKQAKANREASRLKRKNEAQARAATRDEEGTGLPTAQPLAEMDVEEFMGQGFADILNGDSSDDDDAEGDAEDDVEAEADGGEAGEADVGSGEELSDVSEDEDTATVDDANEAMANEIVGHKKSLAKLAKEQPEFYKYLMENDQELLSFAEEAEDSDSDASGDEGGPAESSDDEAGPDEAQPSKSLSADNIVRLVGSLKVESQLKAFNAFRKLVAVFKIACPSAEDDADEDEAAMRIKSAQTQGLLIKSCLKRIPEYLDGVLNIPHKASRTQPLPQASKSWKKFKGLVKIFIKSVLNLMTSPSDPETDIFFLQCATPLCRYFACHPKQNKAFFKLMLSKWSKAADEVRVHAFLVMRQTAIVSPYPFIELCLKGAYLTFIRNCKFPVPSIRPTLTFMQNSVVELYRLDVDATYQHAFIYIRQLAVHLRNATVAKKKDSHLQVYNWQYVYSLRVWCKLLADELPAGKTGLKPLVYPLVQVTLGAMRLVPTSRFLPYKFHCIDALVTLMQKTGIYIPLAASILEALDAAEMKRRPKPTTGKPIVFENALKIGKKQLPTPQFQDAVVTSVCNLAVKFYAAIATSISFPECVYPDTVRLRKWIKGCKAKHVIKKLKPILEKIEENSQFITAARANVTFSPKDASKADAWCTALAETGKSPLQRHYKVWLAAELNRQKLKESVQDIKGDDFENSAAAADGNSDGEEDGSDGDDSEDMMDDGKTLTRMPKKRKIVKEAEEPSADFNSDDEAADDEDVIEQFAMEDFEFDSD